MLYVNPIPIKLEKKYINNYPVKTDWRNADGVGSWLREVMAVAME